MKTKTPHEQEQLQRALTYYRLSLLIDKANELRLKQNLTALQHFQHRTIEKVYQLLSWIEPHIEPLPPRKKRKKRS